MSNYAKISDAKPQFTLLLLHLSESRASDNKSTSYGISMTMDSGFVAFLDKANPYGH